LRKLAEGDPDIALADRYEHNQLAQILRDLDIVVVPSIWYENAPHVISEAFAAKRPVVATDLGGMSEIVANQVNGLLFARGDASDLARQLQRVLDEPGLIPQLQQGIPPIRSLEEEMTELMRVYERVLAKRHREI
jgi:glycosyltransferase involved in cell wall biosynthesis